MNEEQKGQLYGQLLNEHRSLFNEISQLKSENMDWNPNTTKKIKMLEQKQSEIMLKINTLLKK
jgi:hypothetical protein